MKRTLKPTSSKSVNSTTVEKNVKSSNKKKGSASAPVKSRQPEDKEFVMSILEDVEKVLHEGIPNTLPKSHAMLKQIKSDLNELLNMLQQDFPQCINDYSLPNNPQIKTTDVPHKENIHDRKKFQETIITTNKIIPQNKTVNNPTIKSHPIQTKRVEELYQQNKKTPNLDERIAGMKSRLDIYPCFSNNIISTSESDTGVVSESNTVQQLTSFWNDRTKNDGEINHPIPKTFTDHIIDEIFTFGHKEKQHNQMLSKSSLCSLNSNLRNSTLSDLHKSIFCTCDEECTSIYGKKYRNKEPALKAVIPIFKDMSTNTESTVNIIAQEKLKVTNFSQDDSHMKIIIELIGDFSKNISTLVNLDDESIERNNKVKEIGITVEQSTDNKLINRKPLLVSSKKPVTTDYDLNFMNEEFDPENIFKCSQMKNDVHQDSDIFYDESPGKSSNAKITRNKTEGMDYSDILFSTKPTDYCNEVKELNQSSDIVSETEEIFVFGIDENTNDIDQTVYVGSGDSYFGFIQSQSSPLKVNLSHCSDDNEEQSDFHVYPNTCRCNNNDNQLNRIEDKISETTSTINVTRKIPDSSIIHDLGSLKVQTMITDKGEGSKNESCKIKNNCSKHDLINFKINEKENSIVSDGIDQQDSSEISQKESTLSDKHNNMSECFKIISKEILQKEPNCPQKLGNEIDESVEIDHIITKKNVPMFAINRKHLKMCQEMLNNTPSSDLNQITLDTPLEISLEDRIFKNGLEYIWQTYQRGGFELISERDILALILCETIKGKLKNNCLSDETSLFSEINSKALHFKSKTTNFITYSLNTIKKILMSINVRHIFSNSSADIFITHSRSSFEHLTGKEVASFIYHTLISLSMVYIIEEEIFGFFSNSKLVYPF